MLPFLYWRAFVKNSDVKEEYENSTFYDKYIIPLFLETYEHSLFYIKTRFI